MTKTKKIVLGFFTFWPILYIFIFLGFIITAVAIAATHSHDNMSKNMSLFFLIFPLHIFTMLEIMGMMIYYVIDAMKRQKLPPDRRTLWVVLLILGNMIAMPFYWYFFILKERDPMDTSKKSKSRRIRKHKYT